MPPPRMRRPEMVRSIARPEIELERELASAPASTDAVTSLIEQEVNPILDKIGQFGIASLTEDEQRTLERASEAMNRRRDNRS